MIEQWGNTVSNYDTAIQMNVSFSNTNNYFVTASSIDSDRSYHMVKKVDANHIKVYNMAFGDKWLVISSQMVWFATGY